MAILADDVSGRFPGRPVPLPAAAWAEHLVLGIVGCLLAAMPLAFNPSFYFSDDFQSYFMPGFVEIGRLLDQGRLPIITTNSWFGGNLIGEYQYAIFNPVCLLFYFLIFHLSSDLIYAATLYSIFHLLLLMFGSHRLMRAMNCDRGPAVVGALTIGTNVWILYWCAGSWVGGLVSFAWVPWALWALLRSRSSIFWVLPGSLFSYMVFVSGYPYANAALFAATAVFAAVHFREERSLAAVARLCAALTLGVGLAAPALLPLFEHVLSGSRNIIVVDTWRPAIDGIVTLGIPSYFGVWRAFDGNYALVANAPMFYAAWFVPLVLFNANWREAFDDNPYLLKTLIALCGVYLLLCFAPPIGPFRWSFRYIPFVHLALIVLVAVLLSRGGRDGRFATFDTNAGSLLVLAVPFFLAFGRAPQMYMFNLVALVLVAPCFLLTVRAARLAGGRADDWRVPSSLLLGHVAILAYCFSLWPANGNFPRWDHLDARPAPAIESDDAGSRWLSLYESRPMGGEDDPWDVMFGNLSLLAGVESINGYSPVGSKGIASLLCLDWTSQTCSDVSRRLFEIEEISGAAFADLMRIDRISVSHGPHRDAFDRHVPDHWRIAATGNYADTFLRDPFERELPGSVSWVPPGVTLEGLSGSNRSEELRFGTEAAYDGRPIVFARPYFPGYRAWIDGEEVDVRALHGALPSVVLPPRSQGTLRLAFFPSSLTIGLVIAALSLICHSAILAVALLYGKRAGRAGNHAEVPG